MPLKNPRAVHAVVIVASPTMSLTLPLSLSHLLCLASRQRSYMGRPGLHGCHPCRCSVRLGQCSGKTLAHVPIMCQECANGTTPHLHCALTGIALPAQNLLAAKGTHWRTGMLHMLTPSTDAQGRATNDHSHALLDARHAQCSCRWQCCKSMHSASADLCDARPPSRHSPNA